MNDDDALMQVALTRIEGKIDVINERLGALTDADRDHENRLRALERRPIGITPRVLFTSLVSVATVVGTLVSVVTNLAGK